MNIIPRGRPQKEIDKSVFEKLCGLQCTAEEICDFFEISDKTLYKWCKKTYGDNFSVVFKQKKSKGKISLRRMQFRLAENNAGMAIFLGKNYLGQTDNPEVRTSSDNGVLANLIDGLVKNDIHTETTGINADMAEKPTEKN